MVWSFERSRKGVLHPSWQISEICWGPFWDCGCLAGRTDKLDAICIAIARHSDELMLGPGWWCTVQWEEKGTKDKHLQLLQGTDSTPCHSMANIHTGRSQTSRELGCIQFSPIWSGAFGYLIVLNATNRPQQSEINGLLFRWSIHS